MKRREFVQTLATSSVGTILIKPDFAAIPEATVTVQPDKIIGQVDKRMYGHFLEHLENVIYGGIHDAQSAKSNASGIRMDVVQAIKEMGGAHVIRWPGGNFASYYHWKDGIGPRANRPRRLDVVFNQYESNHFGTDEYLELCRLLECEPFITVNMGSGSLEEACQWVEYCRREKRQPPVRLWGLGNEHWGPWQVGYYTADEYARKVQQYAQFMRVVEPDIEFIGVGHTEPEWNDLLLKRVGPQLDWLSIHLYGHRTFLDKQDDFDSTVATPGYFEKEIRKMVEQLDEYEQKNPRQNPIRITLEEWNTRHIRNRNQLWRGSHRNIVDALFTAGVFNVCHRYSNRVKMSNFVFLLNSHAPIVVQGDQLIRTATFDVFRLYATLSQANAVRTEVKSEPFTAPLLKVPNWNENTDLSPVTTTRLDASATLDASGKKCSLFLINRYRDKPMQVKLDFAGKKLGSSAMLHTLTAKDLTLVNTLEKPTNVRSTSQLVSLKNNTIQIPACSVNVLEMSFS
ncbi:MAG: hypothetical protein MUD08_19545 [Cytophagales bacterium]|nr:hypothetical protein [Cytophagales bacterium]